MLAIILSAIGLVAVTITVHAYGLTMILRQSHGSLPNGSWSVGWLLIRIALWLTLIGCVEIAIWGMFYLKMGLLDHAEAAFYFSGATYSTIGYGDVVLPERWRILAPIQGLIGILMCGLSASVFFALIIRIHRIKNPDKSHFAP
jgi:hypothetical protein